MNISVNIMEHGTISLEVEPSDTIKSVKEKIKAKEKLSFGLSLHLGYTLLDDGRTLSSYSVGSNARLECVLDNGASVKK